MSSPLRRDLRISTAEGMAASVMVGVGETYLPVFVLAISGSELACGLASTVPLVIGAVVQLAAPRLMRCCGSYRRWVALCALIQAAAFLPLLLAALTGRMPTMVVFALIAVYWATGLGGNGPWNAWMETLVPSRLRARYFAWRSRICQWGIALGFVGGGVALEVANRWGTPLTMFAFLFLAAAAARFTSARLLASQRSPNRRAGLDRLRCGAAFRALADGDNGRLLLYLLAAQAAMQIAGPYFNPYMLGELRFSASLYVTVVAASIVGKILFLADHRPNRRSRGNPLRTLDSAPPLSFLRRPFGWFQAIGHISSLCRFMRAWLGGPSTWLRCCCSSRRFRGRNGSRSWPSSIWRIPQPSPPARCWGPASWCFWAAVPAPTPLFSSSPRWRGQRRSFSWFPCRRERRRDPLLLSRRRTTSAPCRHEQCLAPRPAASRTI